jgi:fatty acid desaturase
MSPVAIADDLSADFNAISGRLVHASGVSYHAFRKTLKPVYWKVWRDILLGLGALLLISVALVEIPFPGWKSSLVAVLLASVAFGYLHHYLGLFMHEASHFHIAPSRGANDLLSNIFLGVLQGYSIETYRPTHFGHHREIGSPEDPEHHYFHSLDWRLVVMTLSGVETVKVIRRRLLVRGAAPSAEAGKPAPQKGRWVMAAGGLVHASIVVGSLLTGHWQLSLAWTLGFLIWFPFFITIRQILEHRDFDAPKDADFTRQRHGAISRIFGEGPVASTLGGAGFNRHLLHHWEPQVSYTRLGELERFLLETEAGPIIRARKVTYLGTFHRLFQ